MIGILKGKCISCNPTADEYYELFKEEPEKELIYHWESRGVKNTRLDIYIQTPQEDIFKHSIYLKDEDKVSKTGKFLYVNCVAASQWVEDESQLWESFTQFEKILDWENGRPKNKKIVGSKDYHVAKVGEDELLDLTRIVEQIDVYSPDSNVFYNMDKLFEGDYSEVRKALISEIYSVVTLAYMQDGEQKIWRQFLPVGIYREINAGSFSKQNQKIWNDFKKNVESEYGGIDGVYTFDKLREMTIEDNKNIYIPSEDGIDYDSSL